MNFFVSLQYCNLCLSFIASLMLLSAGVILTFKTRFIQFKRFGRFLQLLREGGAEHEAHKGNQQSISSLQALLTAMAATIGMGNVVGPTIAVLLGGPGALFWLLLYPVFSCVTKYTEIMCTLKTRTQLADGSILGGPVQYLQLAHRWLSTWYGITAIFMFAGWSGLQSNTLAAILAQEGVAQWQTGLALAVIVIIIMLGGVSRVGAFASRMVPVMFVLYVSFALYLLLSNPLALWEAIQLVFRSAFTTTAPIGGFLGATMIQAMRIGTHRMAFINECGIGTSAIPHAYADVDNAQDQATLAMYSIFADTFLCLISGLLVIVTGLWLSGEFSSIMIYQAFSEFSPVYGRIVLLISVTFFVVTTVLGNTFNGSRCYAFFSRYKFMKLFYLLTGIIIYLGAITDVPLMWQIMDVVLVAVALPHLVGLLYIVYAYPALLEND